MIYAQFDNGSGVKIEEENLQDLRVRAWIFSYALLLAIWKVKGSTFKAPEKMLQYGNI
jgi:hypothetical protein